MLFAVFKAKPNREKAMRTLITAAAMAIGIAVAALPANDGPYSPHQWGQGQYAQYSDGQMDIYPNPASQRVNIVYPGLAGDAVLTVFSEDGRLMKSYQLGQTQYTRTVLNIDDLADGVYLVRVVQPNGFNYAKRLVVANSRSNPSR